MKEIRITSAYFVSSYINAKHFWIKGDGSRVSVCDMSTAHIKNTLNCIKKKSKTRIYFPVNGKGREFWRKTLENELSLRK